MNTEDRFFGKVLKTETCWTWTGGVGSDGYGCFHAFGKSYKAHRFSWFLSTGKHPELFVLHRCDNKLCVNPEHLFIGTQQDNVSDMRAKERNNDFSVNRLTGNKNSMRRLTMGDVNQIRSLWKQGINKRQLATMFSVDRRTVAGIVERKTWNNV